MKKCTKCNKTKPLEEFNKRKTGKDGLNSRCKSCVRQYNNEDYKSKPHRRESIRANSQARVQAARRFVFDYLSTHPCVDCDESDVIVLEFDHRGDKKSDIASMLKSNNIQSIEKEIAKCDVRCANCHRRKTAKTLGSWRLAFEALK